MGGSSKKETKKEIELGKLKAKAYDIVVEIESLQIRITELQKVRIQVHNTITELIQ